MKLFLLSTILLAFPVTLTDARGDSRPFGAKASKTKSSKSQHGAFDAKSSKSISKTTASIDGTTPSTSEKLTPIDEGRHSKNSEDGGLVVVDGTEGADGSEGNEDDRVTNDIFDDDYSPSSSSSSEGFDPANAMFEWLTKCAAADLDKDTCLVAKTLDYLIDYSSQDDDTTHMPSKRLRALQQEEGCRPELTQQDLRNAMNSARADCNRVSVVYSDERFKRLFYEFWTVISSDSCWEELCESPDIFSKLMFDHLVQCANVDFDVDQCITDHIFSKMLGETDSNEDDDHYYRGGGPNDDHYGDGGHDDGVTSSNPNHRFLRSLEDLMTDCVEDNEFELEFFASFILMEAEGRCAEMGVSVTLEDVSRASADLVTLLSSPHCWGDAYACPEDNVDPLGFWNATSLAETTSTQPAGISPTNEARVDALSNDGNSYEEDEELSFYATAVDEEVDVNEGVSFNNSSTAEFLDDDESTKEDDTFLLISEEDDITDDNETSIEGINVTSTVEDDVLSLSTEGDVDEVPDEEDVNVPTTEGDDNATLANEDILSASTDDDIKNGTSLNIGEGEGNGTLANEDILSASTDEDVKNGTSLNIGEGEGNGTLANEDILSASTDDDVKSGTSLNIGEGDDNATLANEDILSASTDDDVKYGTSLNIGEGDDNATFADEDILSASTDDDIKNGTSLNIGEGDDNATFANEDILSASTDDDIKNGTSLNIGEGEGNGTSNEDSPFSTFVPVENETTPILNSSTSENATISSSSDNSTGSIFNPEVTDGSCDVGPRSGDSERLIEVPYFYIIETIVLEGVVDEIEGMLHLMMCINGVDRRLSVESGETSLVALESSPEDVVSTEYVCAAQSKEAQSCNVIEGMSTLIVEGPDNPEQEEELMTNFYLQLEVMFDMFSAVEDPNIVSLEYVGSDPSSLMTRADLIKEEEVAADDSASLFKIIAIGASVVTLIMVIVGAWKMRDKDDEDDMTLDGKPIDDKSLAAETAVMTALTGLTTTSGSADDTSSDISSTTDAKGATDVKDFYKNKAFVLAEEEEGNWRNLGILPNQLDDIREEFSQSGSEMADSCSV